MENLQQGVPLILLGVIAYLLKDMHSEFKSLSKRLQEVAEKFAKTETKHDARIGEHTKQLEDHEHRIRNLEK